MADEAPANEDAPTGGGKPGFKTFAVVGLIMVLEAVAVFALITITAPSGKSVEAATLEGEVNSDDRPVEVLLVREKFNNLSTGRVWQWDIEVFIEVRQKNQQAVEEILDSRKASITAGIARLIAQAQDRELKEPGLETITRQLEAFSYEIFGENPSDEEPRVERVIVPRFKGFPADF